MSSALLQRVDLEGICGVGAFESYKRSERTKLVECRRTGETAFIGLLKCPVDLVAHLSSVRPTLDWPDLRITLTAAAEVGIFGSIEY